MFSADAGLHDLHQEKSENNYGVFGFMDILYGTYSENPHWNDMVNKNRVIKGDTFGLK